MASGEVSLCSMAGSLHGMDNIFEALRQDHDRQRELVRALLETKGDSAERRTLFDDLRSQLHDHAKFEERFFYVPLMGQDLTQAKARHSVAEHKELDDFVEQLETYDMSSSQWLLTARELSHRLLHHLEEEEHEVFQLGGRALTDQQKAQLGAEYADEMTSAGHPGH